PRLPDEQEQLPTSGIGVLEACDQLSELRLASNEAAPGPIERLAGCWSSGQLGRLVEDGTLELLQLGTGVETEFLGKQASGRAVERERIGLAPDLVEGEHQLAPRAFPEGKLAHKRLQVGDHLFGPAEFEPRLGAVGDGAASHLVQAADL